MTTGPLSLGWVPGSLSLGWSFNFPLTWERMLLRAQVLDKPGFETQINQVLTMRPYPKHFTGASVSLSVKWACVKGLPGSRVSRGLAPVEVGPLSSPFFHSGPTEAWDLHLGFVWGRICAQEVRLSLQLSMSGTRDPRKPRGCQG